MQINEVSQLSPSQYAQFLPKQRFNIPKSTIQKVKSTITSLNSGIVTENFAQSQSTPYSFVVGANNMSVIDLSQMYFNIAGELEFPYDADIRNTNVILGNLFTSSLFQNAQLELGGATIAMNANPGIDANMQAMLKFDFNDLRNYALADRQFMINQVDKDISKYSLDYSFDAGDLVLDEAATTASEALKAFKIKSAPGKAELQLRNSTIYYNGAGILLFGDGTNGVTVALLQASVDDAGQLTGVIYATVKGTGCGKGTTNAAAEFEDLNVYSTEDMIMNYDANCVMPNIIKSKEVGTTGTSRIPFRCKLYLSDLFNYTVDSLDYVFNREIKITLTRSATSNLIANLIAIGAPNNATVKVASTKKFELVCYSYLLTDTARQQLIQYYSQPIETLYGIQTTNLTPLYQSTKNTEQTITLPLTVNYDTKAIILAFPKCSNALVPLCTNPGNIINGQIDGDDIASGYQASWMYSNSNSYNFGGLRYIRISNTNNSSIYTYDFQGTALNYYHPSPFNKSFDIKNVADDAEVTELDYREAYNQYKQLRLLFGKSPENGIDYYEYLKDYCIIPIDLAGTNIPPNTRIMVTFQFADWGDNYNPLNYGNVGNNNGKQSTTNVLAIFLGSDVLAYNPDGTCAVKHVLSANPMEKNVNLV